MKGDRDPFDWSRVYEDSVNIGVMDIYGRLPLEDVFLFSGRSDICREDTIKWLVDFIPCKDGFLHKDTIQRIISKKLFMRKDGDYTDDVIVKYEMFNEHIRDKYRIKFVVDDRPKVCRMWRQLGLNVLQVGDPYIEF